MEAYLALVEQQVSVQKQLSDAQAKLIEQVAAKYLELTDDEIKSLVVDDKWMGALADAVHGEVDRISWKLTGRIRQLAERYATPLPQVENEVSSLASQVDEHLRKMGAVWN